MATLKFSPEVEAAIPALDSVCEVVKFGCQQSQMDAVNTLVVARQLETVARRVIEIEYPQFIADTLIPVNNEMGEEDEFFTFRVWDGQTMAKIVGNYSTDYPLVNEDVREYTVQAFKYGNAYMYSIDDMRKAQRTGIALDTRLAARARQGHEIAKEDIAAIGQPEKGYYGLSNHPNVPVASLPTGAWSNPATTGLQILGDLNFMVTKMKLDTNSVLAPNTLLLPPNLMRIVQIKLLSGTADNSSNISVIEMFQRQNPGITVIEWTKLLNQVILYRRDPTVLEYIQIRDFEQFPAEYRALTYTVACRSTTGGVVIYQPLGVMYAYLGG